MLDRLATKGDLEESTNSRHFEFQGGFVPQRTRAASATINHSLRDWSVSRVSDNVFAFRLVIPSSADVTPAGLATYADSLAFIRWMDTYRSQGDAIPDAFATTAGAFIGRRWTIPINPDDLTIRPATWEFSALSLSSVAGAQNLIALVIRLRIETITPPYTAVGLNVSELTQVVTSAYGTIPGSGQMVEPPFGHADISVRTRRLESEDGNLFMAGGLAVAQWNDPGSSIQRVMPLSGFGRTIDYNDLATRQAGGRYAPRPEERPRVNNVYFDGNAEGSVWLEQAREFVGYAGTDRDIEIENDGQAELRVGVEPNDVAQEILALRPGETCAIRASLHFNGRETFRVLRAPPRYLVRGGSFFNVDSPDYSWSTGNVSFGFRPFFSGTMTTRRDGDEFTFGSAGAHSSGDLLTDGLANSEQVVSVAHHGDLIVYQQTELELRGNGVLKNGHSAVLVRERGGVITIIGRFWNPDLTGVGSHRGYTTAWIDECEPGDRYVTGLLYPTVGTTVGFANVRVNAISQIMRVSPRIVV